MSDNHEPAQPETPKAPGDEGTESSANAAPAAAPAVRDDEDAGNRAPGAPPAHRAAAAPDDEDDGPAPGNARPSADAADDAIGNAVADDDAVDDSIGNRIDGPPTHTGTAQGTQAVGGKTSGSGKKRKRDRRKGERPAGDPAQAGAPGAPGGQAPQGERKGGGGGGHHHGGGDAARRPFHVGDQVRAKVVSLGAAGALVDLWGKEQGVLDLRELQVADAPEPQVGDHVDVVVLQDGSRGGNVVVTRDPQRAETARERVAHAFQHNEAIEGLITGVNRGGLEVDLAGLRGFCPSSQIDARFPPTIAPKSLVLTRQTFKVTSLQDDGREAVVSRRAIVETEVRAKAEEARANIKVGSVVKGIVTSVKEYGVFVDLGGIEGMIHITELTHNRSARPSDVVKVGEEIEAKVLRITGGTSAAAPAPGQTPAATAGDDHADAEAADAATMAEAASDEEVEISAEASAEVEVPAEENEQAAAAAPGDAKAESAKKDAKAKRDRERERERKKPQRRGAMDGLPRVVLSRRAVEPDPWAGIEKKFPPGSIHTGKVARMQPFGAFIELSPGVDGLLHVSELGDGKRLEHPNEVLKDGQTVHVRVERVERGAKRIALSVVPEGVTEEQLKTAVVPRVGMITKAKIVEHESSGGMWAQIIGAIGKTGRGYITPADSNQPRGTDLRKAIALGSEVQVKVVEMDRGRPKLSIRAALQDEERQAYRAYQREATSKPVGVSLADKLRAKLGEFATKR